MIYNRENIPVPRKGGIAVSRNESADRLLSVMRPREDLPRMPGFMAAVFLLLSALAAAAAARLCSPAGGDVNAAQNAAGILAALPFLPLSVSLYALTILLWRRTASLLCTPLSFGLMLLFGARLFDACALSLAILPLSYSFAVSLISRETRFKRMTTLALFAAVGFGLAAVARVGLDFGSVEAFRNWFFNIFTPLFSRMYASSAADPGWIPDETALYSLIRSIFVMLPAWFGMFCVLFSWACDRIVRRLFVWLNCVSVFTDEDADVTLPFRYAAVYAVVFLLTLLTPSAMFPMARTMFQSALLVLGLPCAAVGIRRIQERMSENLFYMTREKFFIGMLLFVAFAALGAFAFLLVTSAVGTVSVIRRHFREKTERNG